jgi:hypothetical protein
MVFLLALFHRFHLQTAGGKRAFQLANIRR